MKLSVEKKALAVALVVVIGLCLFIGLTSAVGSSNRPQPVLMLGSYSGSGSSEDGIAS